MNILNFAERKGFALIVDQIIRHLNDDQWDQYMLSLADKSEKFLGNYYGKETYEGARKLIRENGRWLHFVRDSLRALDPHVIHTAALNLGFQAGFYGRCKTLRLSEEYHLNIPWIIVIDPTSACNMHCTGCWAAEYGHSLNIPYETLDRVIDEGEALGIYFYMFTGGEPTVRWKDIKKLAAAHNQCEFLLFTNSTLIDEKTADEMAKLGNIALSISVEGFEDANDSRRGSGCFQKVMHAMDILKKRGMLFGSSTCYTRKNISEVMSDEFFDLLVEKGCRYAWFFHYMPVGRGAPVDLLPTSKQRQYVYHRIREIRRGAPDGTGKAIFPMDFQNDGEFVGGCIAGGRCYCHINSNGDMEPCVFIHYSNANIRNQSLLDCLRQPLFAAYGRGQPFNENLLRPCPMLENPDILGKLVHTAQAHSTDLVSTEDPENLYKKCASYAKEWKPDADKLWSQTHPSDSH